MSRRGGFQPHGEIAKTLSDLDELTDRMRMCAARMRENSVGSAEVEDRNRRLALAEGAALQEEMKTWHGSRSPRSQRASATTTPAWTPSSRATG